MSGHNVKVFQLLEKLVSIPSVNPSCGGPEENSSGYCGEGRIANFISSWAENLGLECSRIEHALGRVSLIVKLPAAGAQPEKKPTIAYFAHMDTVWTQALENPFTLRMDGDLARGLGACDNKASITTIMLAIEELVKMQERPANLLFVATADEEYGMIGVKELVPSLIRPDAVIVGEPSSLNLVTAHKGVIRWELATKGVSVHSSLVPLGENAIYAAADLVKAAQRHADDILRGEPHGMLGRKTLNVGRINGGRQFNSVPDSCVIQVDRRLIPGEDSESAEKIFNDELMKSGKKFMLSRVFDAPAFEIAQSHPWVQYLYRKIQSCRPGSVFAGLPCATEAAYIGIHGIPSAIFGAGDLGKAHSSEESVRIEEIIMARDIVISSVAGYNIAL